MLRFHLDEHVAEAVANGLRLHGLDVTTTAGAGLRGAGDGIQLAFAHAGGRVLVTHDDDFLRLHAAGASHAGVAFCRQDKYGVGDLLQTLLLLNACYEPQEIRGRVEFL